MDPRNLSFIRAVSDGDGEAVRAMLAEGADANRTTNGGQTPLILAIIFRHIHILPLLLEAGADPQVRDSLGLSAFDWAERKGFTEAVMLLAQSQSPIDDTPVSMHNTEPRVSNRSVSRNVEKDGLPAARSPEHLTRSDEKTRQWIAGMKRRFDEEAGRKAEGVQPAPPPTTTETESPGVPVNDNSIRASTTSAEAGADSEKIPQGRSSTIDPWTKSNRKRCPKCNAVYNSELLAYCAVDMTPLVDANQPVITSPPATATPPLIWILVVSTFIAVASTTYLITDRLTRVKRVSVPAAAPPLQTVDVSSELPVAGEELAGKALTLPRPEYPPTARSEGVGGRILVRVRVDKKGRVISARSVEGDWRLRAAAVKAATMATFSAEMLNDREAAGTIVYTFKP
jgi:TonB family protein